MALVERIEKRRGRPKTIDPEFCALCFAKDSPTWRKGLGTNKTLCNRCGLRLKRLVKSAQEGKSLIECPSANSFVASLKTYISNDETLTKQEVSKGRSIIKTLERLYSNLPPKKPIEVLSSSSSSHDHELDREREHSRVGSPPRKIDTSVFSQQFVTRSHSYRKPYYCCPRSDEMIANALLTNMNLSTSYSYDGLSNLQTNSFTSSPNTFAFQPHSDTTIPFFPSQLECAWKCFTPSPYQSHTQTHSQSQSNTHTLSHTNTQTQTQTQSQPCQLLVVEQSESPLVVGSESQSIFVFDSQTQTHCFEFKEDTIDSETNIFL